MYGNSFEKIYDAVVVGAGLCGIGTALRLASSGLKVMLVERRVYPGWEVTSAFDCSADDNTECETANLLKSCLSKMSGCKGNIVSPPIVEIFLNKFLEEKGVDLLYYSYPLDIITADGLVCGLRISVKSGVRILKARIFVDATDEAFLWKQSDTGLKPNNVERFRYSFFFNKGLTGGKSRFFQRACGVEDIFIEPSIWPDEYCAGFSIRENSISSARIVLPEVLSFMRQNCNFIKEAFVSHSGCELFPNDTPFSPNEDSLRHPSLSNFFASGLWSFSNKKEREKLNSFSGRLLTGEMAGQMIAEVYSAYAGYIPVVKKSDINEGAVESASTDVLVVGAGTAGAVAGIVSARRGFKTLVLERDTMPGGMATGGAVHNYYHGNPGGVHDEIDKQVAALEPVFCGVHNVRGFHYEAKKAVLERMLFESGAKVVYSSSVFGLRMADKRISGVAVVTPYQKMVCFTGVCVDATGDGDLAAMSGARFTSGRSVDGLPHLYSQSAGWFDYSNGFFRGVNFDAGYVDSFDVEDLTRARKLGVSHFYRSGYDEKTRPLFIAPLLGIRQGRNIEGRYVISFMDEVAGRKFYDAVGDFTAHYDNHSYRYHDFFNQKDEVILWTMVLGNFLESIGCEIPYRAMLPSGLEGIVIGCRALSLEDEAQFACRMQRDIQRVGEAAATAACLSLSSGKTLPELDIKVLRRQLKKTGVIRQARTSFSPCSCRSLLEAKKAFFSDSPKGAVWYCSFHKNAVPFLKDVLKKGDSLQRFYAAAALSMHGDKSALPELISTLEQRNQYAPEGLFAASFWKTAIVFMGRIGDKSALPVLIDILDKEVALDVLLLTVRAVGRIGNAAAGKTLLNLLKRKDINCERVLHKGGCISNKVVEDVRWQLDLSVAEVLKKLGRPQDNAVKKYLRDERAYVRRYAEKLLSPL